MFALVRGAPGQGWLLDALALSVTFGVTEISYRWLETPIRRGGLGRMAWRLRLGRWAMVCLSLWAAVTAVALVANTHPIDNIPAIPVNPGRRARRRGTHTGTDHGAHHCRTHAGGRGLDHDRQL
ncbi:MAG: hypothetical protein M3Z25_11270 [Actinomycetota bacterium]|nr:hypothetical protein [Actinomycetota bacterium]